ncbi:MAG: N-acetylneuraminate synthase [Nitrospiraceae bacterium]|nr:MAG: N-acetylneuraminate synthase [Nitrospiraceae bacterium]
MKVFIIAEAGVNHNGSIATARELIDTATMAGADAVKFQTFRAEEIVTKTSEKADYQIRNTGMDESQYRMLKKLELPESGIRELFYYCREKNITFMSTPFDMESADFLEGLGMTIFKVPSGEITNMALIKHIASKKKPVLLSTGMSYLEEVGKAIGWIKDAGEADRLTLLHCVSNYPADIDDTNLRAMETMKTTFGLPVGYSDHTRGIEIPIAAAAMGAEIIEKHFTLDRTMEGPDHKASLEPQELREMVRAIRNVERATGDGIKRPAKNEEHMRAIARRSLVAARTIHAGDIIKPEDITVKRPGTGITPEYKDVIVNMKASRDIYEDSVIAWEDLKNADNL